MRTTLLYTLFCVALVSGCSTLRYQGHPENYRGDRNGDYPVRIVAYSGETAAGLAAPNPKAIPITVVSKTSSKTDGALQGAGRGTVECGIGSLGAGVYAPFIFIPCALFTVPTLAVVGAVIAHPKKEIEEIQKLSQQTSSMDIKNMLTDQAYTYFKKTSMQPESIRLATELIRTESNPQLIEYSTDTDSAKGTILELELLKISLVDVGERETPFCLLMLAKGRKLNAVTGNKIRQRYSSQKIECLSVEGWTKENGENLRKGLVSGMRFLAERLIDDLYLIYHPETSLSEDNIKKRSVPAFVLAPITPQAPEMYLDLRAITRKPKHVLGMGGMHFVDVDNQSPMLSWEAFPRSFDTAIDGVSDLSYEVRIFGSRPGRLRTVEPASLLEEANGLTEPQYAIQTVLQPCSRYFWTVRARFNLNGIRRVTEWAGAYITAGGEVAPSSEFYYPFRTPSIDSTNNCWS